MVNGCTEIITQPPLLYTASLRDVISTDAGSSEEAMGAGSALEETLSLCQSAQLFILQITLQSASKYE